MNEGETKSIECKTCGEANTFHVDEVEARQSKIALRIAAVIFLVGTPLTLYLMWGYFFRTGWILQF